MTSQLIYVSSCPVCGDGLCRIRVCEKDQRLAGMVLCDECEALWTDPTMTQRVLRKAGDMDPICPSTGQSVWGEQSRWANVGEICLLGWFGGVKIAA